MLPGGPLLMTFTPLLGMSEVVRRFILETSPQRTIIKMTQDDAEHYTEEQRANIIAQYPEHMRTSALVESLNSAPAWCSRSTRSR